MAGRSAETKRKVAQAITDAMVEHCDVPAQSVYVLFDEYQESDWLIGGRTLTEVKAERDGA
jgi:4-oxalocrotonate tautomerase